MIIYKAAVSERGEETLNFQANSKEKLKELLKSEFGFKNCEKTLDEIIKRAESKIDKGNPIGKASFDDCEFEVFITAFNSIGPFKEEGKIQK